MWWENLVQNDMYYTCTCMWLFHTIIQSRLTLHAHLIFHPCWKTAMKMTIQNKSLNQILFLPSNQYFKTLDLVDSCGCECGDLDKEWKRYKFRQTFWIDAWFGGGPFFCGGWTKAKDIAFMVPWWKWFQISMSFGRCLARKSASICDCPAANENEFWVKWVMRK